MMKWISLLLVSLLALSFACAPTVIEGKRVDSAKLKEMTPDGFNYYRLGRVHLILKNRGAAQRAFAEASIRLPEDSIYKGPATKLARDLAQ